MRHASTFQSALILVLLLLPVAARAGDAFQRITPAEAGYSEAGLQALAQVLGEAGSESMLLLHDGKVFFEWGDIRQKRLVHSIRKPLLHALIGVELEKGNDCLDLDRTVGDYGLDEDPPGLTAREKTATFRQLLQSRSGIYHPAAAESDGMQARPRSRQPRAGRVFLLQQLGLQRRRRNLQALHRARDTRGLPGGDCASVGHARLQRPGRYVAR